MHVSHPIKLVKSESVFSFKKSIFTASFKCEQLNSYVVVASEWIRSGVQ